MRKRKIVLPLKRKRLGKTDYHLRYGLLTSGKPRFVVRKSLRNIVAQFVVYDKKGDKIVASAHSNELKKYGATNVRKNLPVAYLVGCLAGMKAKQKNVKEAVFDIGLYRKTKGSLLFAALNGALDAGIQIPHSKEVLPPADRIQGKHLKDAQFATMINTIKQKLKV